LEAQDELAETPLRKALESKLDLETRRRVELILSKLPFSFPTIHST
jgi:hypothetical protein